MCHRRIAYLDPKTGNSSIEVGQLDALPTIIDTLSQAVMAGELDAALTAAVADRKKNLRRGLPGKKHNRTITTLSTVAMHERPAA